MLQNSESQVDVTVGNRTLPTVNAYEELRAKFSWPRNPTGWVFLGRAVHLIGQALFQDWRKYTPYGLLPDVLLDDAVLDTGTVEDVSDQFQYANWLINYRGDDPTYIYRTNRPFDYLEAEANPDLITAQEWAFACDLSQEEWAIGMANRRMFDEVQLKIVEAGESGALTIGARPIRGGEPEAMPRDLWFTDNYAVRFKSLTIDPAQPFSEALPDRTSAHHLFVKSDNLEAFLSEKPALTSASSGNSNADSLSPYLRLMLEVHDHLGITSALQPKKASIALEIASRWSAYNLPASAILMKSMATLLREPESQAGRARKSI